MRKRENVNKYSENYSNNKPVEIQDKWTSNIWNVWTMTKTKTKKKTWTNEISDRALLWTKTTAE